jgi:hypothetical protein
VGRPVEHLMHWPPPGLLVVLLVGRVTVPVQQVEAKGPGYGQATSPTMLLALSKDTNFVLRFILPGMVIHTCNPSTKGTKAEGLQI